jgi:hypothetical protein
MGTLREDLCTLIALSCRILHEMRNVSDKIIEKIRTYFVFSNFSYKCAITDIMLKNVVDLARPHMTTQHGACTFNAG